MPDVELRILHAGNIGKMMGLVADKFREQFPDVRVAREKDGSVNIVRNVSARTVKADIVATADYKNIRDFLYEKFTGWYGMFATTSMVLVYSDESKFSGEIAADNWHEVISRPGVRIKWGDPDVDPGAYRRIMIGKLAEKYYGQPGLATRIEANVMSARLDNASHAIPLLKSSRVDYSFMYKPAAVANGLKHLDLPPQVNLGDPSYKSLYESVDAMSLGARVTGDVITYGISVMGDSACPGQAFTFIEILLGPAGERIIRECGFQPVKPFTAVGDVPPPLKRFI